MMKSLGFVILTWNSDKYIAKCLDSILALSKVKCYISIVDNGSQDDCCSILKKYSEEHDNIIVNYLDKNYGTTKSRNIGLKELNDVDYICILDSDTEIVDESGFMDVLAFLDDHPQCGIVGPKLVNAKGVLQYSGRNIPTTKEKMYKVLPFKSFRKKAESLEHVNYDEEDDFFPVGYLMSACWIMRRDAYDQIGLLDEHIFYAPEDVEYCLRSWSLGLKVIYYKNCTVLHHWQRISRKKFFSKHNYEHIKGLKYLKRKYKKELKVIGGRILETVE